jgi:hypothetical protein
LGCTDSFVNRFVLILLTFNLVFQNYHFRLTLFSTCYYVNIDCQNVRGG